MSQTAGPIRISPSGDKIVGENDGDTLLWNAANEEWQAGPGGGGGAVDSVFGRTGAVVAANGDYDSTQITNASTVAGATVTEILDTLSTSDGIGNASPVPGTTVTDALDDLDTRVTDLEGGGGSDASVYEYREHFMSVNSSQTIATQLGTGGSYIDPVPSAGHPGILTNRVASATTGSATLVRFSANSTVTCQLHPFFVPEMRMIVRRSSLTGMRWGFGICGVTQNGTLGLDGGMGSDWTINFATMSTGNWLCVTRATAVGGVTTADLGFAPVSGTWYVLRIVLNLPTSAEFYIDGVLVHTAVATLPTLADIAASGFGQVAMTNHRQAVGDGSDRLVDMDEVYYRMVVAA